jgi:hypothetical protein
VLIPRTGRAGNRRNTGSQYVHKGRVRAFFKNPLQESSGELLSVSRNQIRIMTGLLTGHWHLKGHLLLLRLVSSPECDRCMQASETDTGTWDLYFMKPGDYGNISAHRILHFVQGAQTSAVPTLLYPILFYSNLYHPKQPYAGL